MYASLDEICANDSKPFFSHRPSTVPYQPPPVSFPARPRNGPINISAPYGGVVPKEYSSYAPALPVQPAPPHQFIHPSISPPTLPLPPPAPLQPSEQRAQEFFQRQTGCQSAIEHIRVCKECKNKLEIIQEKEDSQTTIDNLLEIATFVSAGLLFVYMMDSIVNMRRK